MNCMVVASEMVRVREVEGGAGENTLRGGGEISRRKYPKPRASSATALGHLIHSLYLFLVLHIALAVTSERV